MTWAKLSDNFHSHPKTERMGLDGAGLYAIGISYAACHLTDGFLPAEWVRKQAPTKLVNRLVDIGAWAKEDGGYRISDFLDYNPSRERVLENRRVTKDRVTRYRTRTNAGRNALPEPDPYPTPELHSVEEEIYNGNGVDVGEYVDALADSDEKTPGILKALRKELPEAAFRNALEALELRRGATDAQPLVSETRYFVATLASMKREGQYAMGKS